MKNKFLLGVLAGAVLALPSQAIYAGDKPFPTRVPVLDGSQSEGFAIGKGPTAYNSSPDGSIYKVNLRSGNGEVLVPPGPDPFDCRSKLLFEARRNAVEGHIADFERPRKVFTPDG